MSLPRLREVEKAWSRDLPLGEDRGAGSGPLLRGRLWGEGQSTPLSYFTLWDSKPQRRPRVPGQQPLC